MELHRAEVSPTDVREAATILQVETIDGKIIDFLSLIYGHT